ncbi:MAG: alpha/beta fold hydrolase [Pseudomonadales bacterium]
MATGTLSVDNCELYYEEAGSGPPVLLIHGAGAYAGLFRPCVAELESTHRIITYDRRGCSRSSHPPVRDLKVHVVDAARLIRELFGQPVIVVGWSAGAMIAPHLAISHPETTASLVLAEPPLQLKAPRPIALGAVARWELKRLTSGPKAGAEVFYRWVSQYRGDGNAFDTYPQEWRDEMLNNAAALFAEIRLGGGALGEGVRRSQLAALQLPIQVLFGTRSAPVFAPAARYLLRVVQGSELVMVPEAGHMIPTDRPDLVTQAVRRASDSVV